jgi:hypothetical protein
VKQAAALRGLALTVTHPTRVAMGDRVKVIPPLTAP